MARPNLHQGKQDRPVRDCQHTRVRHEHGTRLAYVCDRCRCPACTQANTAEARRRSTAIAYGTWAGLVDAASTRAHLHALRAAGLSLPQIARLAGVGQGTVNALSYGEPARQLPPPRQVRSDTQHRLLAVRADSDAALLAPAGRRVPSVGTRRRLQALAAVGWTVPALTAHAALSGRTLNRLLQPDTTSVTIDTARTVAALYTRLRVVPPPQSTDLQRTAARQRACRALACGWRPPQGWHDIDRDPDPSDHDGDSKDREGDVGAGDDAVSADHNDRWRAPGSEPDVAVDLREFDLEEADSLASGQVVDEVAVERAMTGERLALTTAERREAVQRLTRRGLSARDIAGLLHTTSRTVVRLRGAARERTAA